MQTYYLEQIRSFEGYTPKAEWDYAQFTNGYGTRARYAGEVISKTEADQRFRAEIQEARSIVEKAAPHVDEGTKAALTSLTYNAGPSWVNDGLGDAVRSGDLTRAREIFVQYNKAGGDVLQGLVNRRLKEAAWIGSPDALGGAGALGAATAKASSFDAAANGPRALPSIPVRADVAQFVPGPGDGDPLGDLLKAVSRGTQTPPSATQTAAHTSQSPDHYTPSQALIVADASSVLESAMVSDLALMAQTGAAGAGSVLSYYHGDIARAGDRDKSGDNQSRVTQA